MKILLSLQHDQNKQWHTVTILNMNDCQAPDYRYFKPLRMTLWSCRKGKSTLSIHFNSTIRKSLGRLTVFIGWSYRICAFNAGGVHSTVIHIMDS